MTPLNDALYRYVMNTRKLHTDDTPVKVLALGLKRRKQGASGRMSGMIAMRVRHLLRRSGSRTHRTGRGNTRSNTSAPLQADAFNGYDRLFSAEREDGALTEVAC